MKNFILFSVLIVSISCVSANNLYQDTNPFPQTSIQTMNNIYESEPAVMKNEIKKQPKKTWFRRSNQTENSELIQQDENKGVNEGTNDGSFYLFK